MVVRGRQTTLVLERARKPVAVHGLHIYQAGRACKRVFPVKFLALDLWSAALVGRVLDRVENNMCFFLLRETRCGADFSVPYPFRSLRR